MEQMKGAVSVSCKIFHVLSGQLNLICKYASIPAIQASKKLGQGQFRAINEVK